MMSQTIATALKSQTIGYMISMPMLCALTLELSGGVAVRLERIVRRAHYADSCMRSL